MTAQTSPAASLGRRACRRDRWVDALVIIFVLLALALGWAVKTAAEGRRVSVQGEGLRISYPAGWVRANAQPPVLLRVEDRMAPGFPTTLMVERRPLPAGMARPLVTVQQMRVLERGNALTAFRVLQTEEPVTFAGQTGLHSSFAYVETNPDPFLETVPEVVRGDDYLVVKGDQVYIFTLLAGEARYEPSQKALLALIRSWAQ